MHSSNVDTVENVEPGSPNHVNDVSVGNLHAPESNTNSKTFSGKEPRTHIFLKTYIKKMVILIRELCFIMLLVVSYAAFQNNTPKVSKSPNAFPFFPPGSLVKDWYQGQLSEAINQASESDLAFVMYYAPWDAESQSVRHEFVIVSQHMHQYVHFAAINCWQPGSECHSVYSKVYSWPVLMAYTAHGPGIQYKGPKKAEHMIKFLQTVLQPFIRISTSTELNIYRAQNDAVVVGFVDSKISSHDYGVLYSASLRFLERDPLREIQFLIVSGNAYQPFTYVTQLPALQLIMWNETIMYPKEKQWRPESIISWIFENLQQVSVWVVPPGSKSQYLTTFLQPGPALILFTPRNPLYEINDYYSILHEVAMEYYNCNKSLAIEIQKMILYTIKGTDKDYFVKHKKLLEKCSVDQQPENEEEKKAPVITYNLSRLLLNNTCSVDDNAENSFCFDMSKINKNKCDKVVTIHPHQNIYLDVKPQQKTQESSEKIKNQTSKVKTWTSTLIGEDDHRSPENLKRLAITEKCRIVKIAHHLQPALFTPRIKNDKYFHDNVTGMGCKTNMSLSILALDSLQNYNFAENLGIDILRRKDKTAVVIMNPKLETHHVMMQPYNIINLRNFIRNFANGNLKRILTSSFTSNLPDKYNFTRDNFSISATWQTKMVELTTSTFLPTVMKIDQVVIILYHSIKCAFCSGIAHVLLAVSRLLSPVSNLHFARIDGDHHALPWEYSMHHYPTILFFPAQRKSESRAFPHNVPITVPNILSFILANVESEMRLHIIWTLCKQSKFNQDQQACTRTLRLESTSLVGKLLREYRSSNSARQSAIVFKRLQHIRLLQFLFTSPVKLHANVIQQHMAMLYTNTQTESNSEHKKL